MSEGYKKHTDFYNMVKEWTVSDYCTPGIKAEVILDMLISDFIEELIQYHYSNTEGRTCSVRLLAKEFPIRSAKEFPIRPLMTKNSNLRNAKVDYLMYVNNAEEEKVVLVELKTTNESFDTRQKERMERAKEKGVKELIDFYNDIYDKLVNRGKGNPSDGIKYQYSYNHFPENWKNNVLKRKRIIGPLNLNIDYLYIFLTDNDKLSEEVLPTKKRLILKSILDEYCKNKKFEKLLKSTERIQLWKSVSDILKACISEMEPGANGVKKINFQSDN